MSDFPAVAATLYRFYRDCRVWSRLGSYRSNEVGGRAVSANVGTGVVMGPLRRGFDERWYCAAERGG